MTTTTTTIDAEDNNPAQTFIVGDPGGSGRLIQRGSLLDDKYLVKGVLGRGGMGCVFRAEHTIMRKDYAIKVLSPSCIDSESLRRFEAEGRVIAKLDHPVIVKVHNMGVDGGDCPFYVMDLLPGVPLSDLCGPNWHGSINDILGVFREIADGLAYAHAKGVIHRDIKPSNIIVLADQQDDVRPKIVDFGIAKVQHAAFEGQSQTKVGEVFGSPLYMSPEQSMGQPCDERTDIYSLGCTLFEVLTGSPPFKGASSLKTLMMHQDMPPPSLGQMAPDQHFSAAIEQLVSKMLAKSPDSRYQSMSQVIHDLDRILAGKAVGKSALEQKDSANGEAVKDDVAGQRLGLSRRLALASTVIFITAAVVGLLMITKGAGTAKKTIKAVNLAATSPAVVVTGIKHEGDDVIDNALDKKDEIDPFNRKSVAILESAPVMESQNVDYNGRKYRRLVMPGVSVGEVAADNTYIEPQPLRAGGEEVLLPLQATRTRILVSAKRQSVAFFNPSIFKKIAKKEFTTLQIDGQLPEGLLEVHPESVRKATMCEAQILHIASSWTRLNELILETVSLNDISVQRELDRFNHLTKLDILRAPDTPVAYLAASPILNGLKEFSMVSSGPVGPVIDRLLADGSVTKLHLDGSAMTVGLAKKLDQYNKIEALEIGFKAPPDSVLDAIGQIRSLHQLRISKTTISDARIFKLCQNKNIAVLILDKAAFSEADVARLGSSRVRFE